jgi:hypothetical protein
MAVMSVIFCSFVVILTENNGFQASPLLGGLFHGTFDVSFSTSNDCLRV